MIKLAVSGCQGRMGQSITRLALQDKAFKLSALLEHKDHPKVNQTEHGIAISADNRVLKGCDVLIEFTTPQATIENLQACLDNHVKMVIGTTGLQPEQAARIKEAAKRIPIVYASNMSVGVNILFKLTQIAAQKTGAGYTIHITETHHVHKKDAPSGTAKTLAEIAEASSKSKVKNIESRREGEVIGDHSVLFESEEDIITIAHHAKNRDIFAKGALVAAKFLAGKSKGLFNMQEVLGLN
ncbi:MAG: 4-hydroxy-tetrahydrodipicolinate reductase [Omnitrophica WOR_2 bacterium RIFCSPHIGHO2_02_FULL_52_10]|nr:MAG: 4-hydroxy-tetrahydrodipicolinate reductase [Omnitrophica WOR_2 bacterium RIFCSPHIGHO2_02_FULL_52_10]